MHFTQKALIFNRAEFNFGDKKLDVMIDDGRLKIGFSVAYHEIGAKRSIKSFPEKAVTRCAIAILLAVLACYGVALGDVSYSGAPIFGGFAAFGLLLCILAGYAKFDATRIPIATGNTILVFHDDQYQTIINEIYKRRKSEILRLHGEVDTLNHPQLELKKFLWLKDEKVLTEQEFDEARLKIATLSKTPSRLL